MTTGQEAVFDLSAADDLTPPVQRPAGFSAQVDNYPVAYIALQGGNHLHVVAKTVGTVNVTINGHSDDGTALPPLSLQFVISAPPVPQATHFVATTPAVKGTDITTPADPGTDTVTGTV